MRQIVPIVQLSGVRPQFAIFAKDLEHNRPEVARNARTSPPNAFCLHVLIYCLKPVLLDPSDLLGKKLGAAEHWVSFVSAGNLLYGLFNKPQSLIGFQDCLITHPAA